MSPRFEAFIAKLYVNAELRERFLADARREASRAGLSPPEIEAASRIDRTGLELAARGFEHKRRQSRRRVHALVRVWRRLLDYRRSATT